MDKLQETYGGSPNPPADLANTDQRFDELKRKFSSVTKLLDDKGLMIRKMRVQDNKLMLTAVGGSEADVERLNQEIDRIDPDRTDIEACFQAG